MGQSVEHNPDRSVKIVTETEMSTKIMDLELKVKMKHRTMNIMDWEMKHHPHWINNHRQQAILLHQQEYFRRQEVHHH